jgi:hypothetical protein
VCAQEPRAGIAHSQVGIACNRGGGGEHLVRTTGPDGQHEGRRVAKVALAQRLGPDPFDGVHELLPVDWDPGEMPEVDPDPGEVGCQVGIGLANLLDRLGGDRQTLIQLAPQAQRIDQVARDPRPVHGIARVRSRRHELVDPARIRGLEQRHSELLADLPELGVARGLRQRPTQVLAGRLRRAACERLLGRLA